MYKLKLTFEEDHSYLTNQDQIDFAHASLALRIYMSFTNTIFYDIPQKIFTIWTVELPWLGDKQV